jgi:hypothetical protein
MKKIAPLLLAAAVLAAAPIAASAAGKELSCKLKFTSEEWSALYQSAMGKGTVACDGGTSMPVTISAKGIGLTAGKWRITEGTGTFTHVAKMDDVLGSYLSLSGNVGAEKAGTAPVLTKGQVSLALAGKGEGFDVGIAISDFKISKAAASKPKSAPPVK